MHPSRTIHITSDIESARTSYDLPGIRSAAMHLMNQNNRLYRDLVATVLHILTVDELPPPIIIDNSQQVESENTEIESL
jgi:hypothetical protein